MTGSTSAVIEPTIIQGDARALSLPASSVDLVITGPPYFGLRTYRHGQAPYSGQLEAEDTNTREMIRVLKPSRSLFINLGDKQAMGLSTPSKREGGCDVSTDLERLTARVSRTWAGFLRDWDRTLRSGNYPQTTRYNYILAAAQLASYLAGSCSEDGASAAAEDPTDVRKEHIEAFQAWMVETRSASTALNKHKGLQQFFKWLMLDEEEIDRSPMERVKQPKRQKKLIPLIRDDETKKVLDTCKGKDFVHLRDEAIVRLYYNTGARLSEVGKLHLADVDLSLDSVHYRGKGGKERRVRFGPRTARAISRYLRAREKHAGADLSELWLAERGRRPLAPNGIKMMLRRRGMAAGLTGVHAHRWRHNFAHEWKRAGGDTGDLMLLLGWTSEDMPRHYGASAAAERAQETQMRLGLGENV